MDMQEYWDKQASSGRWGSLYNGKSNLRTYNFITRRKSALGLIRRDGQFKRILDVGCGTGDYAEAAPRHRGTFFGIDFAWNMIREAKERAKGSGSGDQYLVGSGEHLPYQDDSFDLILAMGYIEYFHNPGRAIREIRRVLRPAGILVMQSYKPDLFGKLDRYLINPLRPMFYRLRKQMNAQLPQEWVDRRYSKRQLDGLLAKSGFERTRYTFNNFQVLPGFLRVKYPKLYINLSEKLDRSHPRFWRFLAVNYIARYVLRKARSERVSSPVVEERGSAWRL